MPDVILSTGYMSRHRFLQHQRLRLFVDPARDCKHRYTNAVYYMMIIDDDNTTRKA